MIQNPQVPESKSSAGRSFVSEIFHELSQPLTAVQCRLELALRRDETVEQLRETIETVLENAERMRQRLLLLRSINDSTEAGNDHDTTDLNDLLRELQETFDPLFEAEEKNLAISSPSQTVLVRGNRGRLMQALFYFLEYLFRYAKPHSTVEVTLSSQGPIAAGLRIAAESSLPVGLSEDGKQELNSLELEMSRRTFQAAGGDFRLVSWDAGHSLWLARLVLA